MHESQRNCGPNVCRQINRPCMYGLVTDPIYLLFASILELVTAFKRDLCLLFARAVPEYWRTSADLT